MPLDTEPNMLLTVELIPDIPGTELEVEVADLIESTAPDADTSTAFIVSSNLNTGTEPVNFVASFNNPLPVLDDTAPASELPIDFAPSMILEIPDVAEEVALLSKLDKVEESGSADFSRSQ